ncbi:hypothetical protein JOC86_000765 [Bacillus pakistanensis]|uniref:Uncharacterized protein n=1 Tax=Rossellomorea pakistanensis TaxID=992288 RepID=A0ABS2N8R4_9BACI|nr:hypothetical protein [Bacillus pakistanensis]MBM7584228.1 hypothetical protein [Bacillus pakistanensis]
MGMTIIKAVEKDLNNAEGMIIKGMEKVLHFLFISFCLLTIPVFIYTVTLFL